MYTKLDDQKHAKKINDYLIKNPMATQKEISINLLTNFYRIKYLVKQGLVHDFTRKSY
jgi:hypothetical protein